MNGEYGDFPKQEYPSVVQCHTDTLLSSDADIKKEMENDARCRELNKVDCLQKNEQENKTKTSREKSVIGREIRKTEDMISREDTSDKSPSDNGAAVKRRRRRLKGKNNKEASTTNKKQTKKPLNEESSDEDPDDPQSANKKKIKAEFCKC